MEARAYGLARRYKPFLLNSVVGFIGPEYLCGTPKRSPAPAWKITSWASSGISMGCDACYTNHAESPIKTIKRTWRCSWPRRA
jgi:ethanolamine ammonia-lyase large subunit